MGAIEYIEQFVRPNLEHTLIDVRRPEEYDEGHLVDSINIPLQEIEDRLSEISVQKPVVLYCRTGNRSGQAAELLKEKGYEAVLNAGGLAELNEIGLAIEFASTGII